MIGKTFVNKTWGLLHKNCFREVAIYKIIFDIQLMQRPPSSNNNRKHDSNSGKFNNLIESV